jgi:predicted nucleotidyltransferase
LNALGHAFSNSLAKFNSMSRLLKLDPNFKPAFDGLTVARELIQKLNDHRPVKEAYLFGSAAEGKNTADSDLDILVVIADDQDPKDYYQFVNQAGFSSVAVDWIIKKSSEFDQKKDQGGVCFIAFHQGKRIDHDAK